jgi:hypothetical protein
LKPLNSDKEIRIVKKALNAARTGDQLRRESLNCGESAITAGKTPILPEKRLYRRKNDLTAGKMHFPPEK